jgi:type IV pilus assembly protein PilY1
VYAGDKAGNIWRFDLTSSNPANWAAASYPLFTTGGQPITTNLVAVSVPTAGSTSNRLLIEFGTGAQTPFTVTSTTTFATGQQDLYGIWDWNMGGWNAISSTQYASLSTGTSTVPYTTYGICGPQTGTATSGCTSSASSINITAQSVNSTGTFADGTNYRTVTQNPVCWIQSTVCTGGSSANNSYGWYLPLPGTNEQIIYSPNFEVGAFVVNTTIPTAAGTSCVVTPTTGYTMAISPATGGAFTNAFFGTAAGNFETVNGLVPSGVQLNGTGTPTNVTSGTSVFLVTQNIGGSGTVVPINPAVSSVSKRLTWVEKR